MRRGRNPAVVRVVESVVLIAEVMNALEPPLVMHMHEIFLEPHAGLLVVASRVTDRAYVLGLRVRRYACYSRYAWANVDVALALLALLNEWAAKAGLERVEAGAQGEPWSAQDYIAIAGKKRAGLRMTAGERGFRVQAEERGQCWWRLTSWAWRARSFVSVSGSRSASVPTPAPPCRKSRMSPLCVLPCH
jgi:hypothetical protein